MTVLKGGEIDERLEGRSGLALRVGGAVVRALFVGRSAHHGAHRAVRRHGDQGRLARSQLLSFFAQTGGDGALGFGLRVQIETRVDD